MDKCSNCKEKGELTSYFDRSTNARKTVCDKCAANLGLNDLNKYYAVPFKGLNQEQQVRPKQN